MINVAIETLNSSREVGITELLYWGCDELWKKEDIFKKVILGILWAEERLYCLCEDEILAL